MKARTAILLLFLLSCESKTAVPKGIIPIPKMTSLLWDVMLADELVRYRYPADSSGKKLDTSVVLYQQIAKAHSTTQQQFKQSMQFYESRPDLLQLIIDSLQKRASIPLEAYKHNSTLPQ